MASCFQISSQFVTPLFAHFSLFLDWTDLDTHILYENNV